ncbi:hypothetical protein LTR27_001276 [Elasticomyces elasticus]|nr:hypothetical protein LTR27_001276 [Elasticomyces elasticus]
MAPRKSDTDIDKFDRYYRLDNTKSKNMHTQDLYFLATNAGYPTSGSGVTRAVMLRYASRIRRGLLCYHLCTNTELQRFMDDRNLTSPKEPFLRTQHILELELWDELLKFKRFMDLPPELRAVIYDFYMAGFPQVLNCPAQPPLSRTGRLVRSEMLGSFCKQTIFKLNLKPRKVHGENELHFEADATTFLPCLDTSKGMFVRSLYLTFEAAVMSLPRHQVLMVATVTNDCLSYEAKATAVPTDDDVDISEESIASHSLRMRLQRIEDDADELLRGIVSRGGKGGLGMNDIYALRVVLEEAWL